jgi:hypothetical protein
MLKKRLPSSSYHKRHTQQACSPALPNTALVSCITVAHGTPLSECMRAMVLVVPKTPTIDALAALPRNMYSLQP